MNQIAWISLLTLSFIFLSTQAFAQYVARESVDVVDGWDKYIYYCKTCNKHVYADTADGRIARVTLSGPVGFEGGSGVPLDPSAVQALASLYEPWLFGRNPPTGDMRNRIAKSVYLARKAIGSDYSTVLGITDDARSDLKSEVGYMKFDLPPHLTGPFYEHLKNIEPKVEVIQIPQFGTEKVSIKKIEDKQFRLIASKKHSTGEHKVTFEAWKNPNALDRTDRKIVEGSGDFARNFHAAMFSQFWTNNEYRYADDGPLPENDQGIATCDLGDDLKLIFRKVDSKVYFHMDVVYSGNLTPHSTRAFMRNVPELTRTQDFHVEEHPTGSPRRNSVYRSGSSTYYRGLDGVTREAVRDPTGP